MNIRRNGSIVSFCKYTFDDIYCGDLKLLLLNFCLVKTLTIL